MAKRFHIGTRGPAVCSAQKGGCPFGGASGSEDHFNTMSAAAAAYEASMGGSLSEPLQKELLEDVDRDILLAADDDTPRSTLSLLSRHSDPVVRRVVAASSRASVSLLRKLAIDDDEETRASVASNENTDSENLGNLLEDKSMLVATSAAKNSKTPRHAIEKADVEGSRLMAAAVASNSSGNVSVRMFKRLSKIDDQEVQNRLVVNPAAPDKVVTDAVIGFRQANSLMEDHPNPPASAVEAAWMVHTANGRTPDVELYASHDSTPENILAEIEKYKNKDNEKSISDEVAVSTSSDINEPELEVSVNF